MPVAATQLEVSSDNDECLGMIRKVAADERVSAAALRLEALLHLPRLASPVGLVDSLAARNEVQIRAADLRTRTRPAAYLARRPRRVPASPTELTLRCDARLAREIVTRFHYLTSFRLASEHVICVTAEGSPVALATISPLDLHTIKRRLPAEVPPDRVQVLSRVFAFEWAPANTLTWLFGQIARRLRDHADLLVTYVNPNIGFTGASYRAGNWALLALEEGTRYAYLDRRYVTDRELIRAHGTSDPAVLRPRLGQRIEYSRMPLRPLNVYGLAVTKVGHSAIPNEPWIVPRPTP